MPNQRILFLSATFGAGHVRAAEAIIEEILKRNPMTEITHLDYGELLSPTFNTIIKNTYLGIIKHTPKLWRTFYYGTARISPDSRLQRFFNSMGSTDLLKYVNSIQPDLIVCTYPTVAGVLAQLRLKKALNVPLVMVVTDYAVHNQWIHKGADMYFAGCRDVYEGLVSRGIDSQSILVTGIPVSPRFELQSNRCDMRSKLGLFPDRPTFLIMGGAYGVLSNLKGVCAMTGNMSLPSQTIVVCGHNEKLYNSLDDVMENSLNPIIRFGYVNNIEELMTAADVIVTKAGGLIVTEALTKRLPLVIFNPIPGQEEENANFLSKIGAGKTANNLQELEQILHFLLIHPQELKKMQQGAAQALPGKAAKQIVDYILSLEYYTGDCVKMG